MKIIQLDPSDSTQRRIFNQLPFTVYQDIPQWVPPLSTDLNRYFDLRKPFYKHLKAAFFLAFSETGTPLARLAVIDSRKYNEYNQTNSAFFYQFECLPDETAAAAILASGFDWARQQGLDTMLGPKGFTALDGLGMLVRGFEHRPAIGIPYNPPYYPAMIEAAGFASIREIVSGHLDETIQFPEKMHEISRLVQQRRGLEIAVYKNKRDLRKLIPRLKDLYNGSLTGTSGNAPLTDDEAKSMADQILWFADPHLIKIILHDGDPVGFLFAYPDISAAIQRTRGKVFPFGWIDLLLEMKRTKWMNMNGAGIIEKYRGLGGTAILFSEMFKSAAEGGFRHADLVQIGLENDKMMRELRELGIDFYKVHRIYQKAL